MEQGAAPEARTAMSIIAVALPPDTERKLREKAGSAGLTLETYLGRLAEADAAGGPTARDAAFDAAVAPVRAAFKNSGLTDADLTDLVQEARDDVWLAKLVGTAAGEQATQGDI